MKRRMIGVQLFLGMVLTGIVSVSTLWGASTYDPALEWKTLKTEHFSIHFHSQEEDLAKRVATIAETVHPNISQWLNWEPEHTDVVLNDRVDVSNGAATPFVRNTMYLFATPPDDISSLEEFDDWLTLLIVHEYTHIVHLDQAFGAPKTLRNIFGRLPLWFPTIFQPNWITEGLATYRETDESAGYGRGQSAFFRMLMRLEVEGGLKTIYEVNSPALPWPMSAPYLYGVYFYQFLQDHYGDPQIVQWINTYSENWFPFLINATAYDNFSMNMTELWEEKYHPYLKQRFEPEIQQLKASGLIQGQQITQHGYLTKAPQIVNGVLYYLKNDYLSEQQLMKRHLATGKTESLTNVHFGGRFDVHPTAGILLSHIDLDRSTNLFADIYHVDPNTGEKTQLTEAKRYRNAIWHPNGKQILAVHNQNSQSALHRLDANGNLEKVLWQGTPEEVIGPLDISSDGRTIAASLWRRDLGWTLEVFSMASQQWTPLIQGNGIATHPRFSPEGQSLFFSASFDGIYNIYELDLRTQQLKRWTHVLGGAFAPAISDKHQLVYVGYHSQGADLYQLSLNNLTPQIMSPETWKTPKPQRPPRLDEVQVDGTLTDYSPAQYFLPTWWLPYFQFDGIRSEVGFSTQMTDPLQRHTYSMILAVDVSNQWPVGTLVYNYDRWNPGITLRYTRSYSRVFEEEDDNNDIKLFYRDTQTGAELDFPWLKIDHQWIFKIGTLSLTQQILNEDTRDQFKNAFTLPEKQTDNLAGVALQFQSTKRFPLSISLTDGRQVAFVSETSSRFGGDFTGEIYSLDWREYIALNRPAVFATRLKLGWGEDAPRPFQLGGSESSLILGPGSLSETNILFGVRDHALRGYPEGLASLRGRRMILGSVEWRFPLWRVEGHPLMPPVGIDQLFGTLFVDSGDAWDEGSEPTQSHTGVGAELIVQMSWGFGTFNLPSDFRFGLAQGVNQDGESQAYLTSTSLF